jgi:hypothetical protein
MTQQEAERVLAVVRAQHQTIDRLMAMLVVATRDSDKPFMPSQSGPTWDAVIAGHTLIGDITKGTT